MTDEQIRQNAVKYSEQYCSGYVDGGLVDAYIAGAHSRDEEIGQLKIQIENAEVVLEYQKNELDQLRNPWISVEDRLPEIDQKVFVLFGESSVEGIGYMFDDEDKVFMVNGWGVIIDVTHWMPIPKTPLNK